MKKPDTTYLLISAWGMDNRIIGYEGQIPWHVPEDFDNYKAVTRDSTLIMGKDTYLSIPKKFRPLKDRQNIVVSSTLAYADVPGENIIIVKSVEEAIGRSLCKKVFFNGGESIYQEGMKYATKILGTIIDYQGPGDRFFPEIGPEWDQEELKTKKDFLISKKNNTRYLFVELNKKQAA